MTGTEKFPLSIGTRKGGDNSLRFRDDDDPSPSAASLLERKNGSNEKEAVQRHSRVLPLSMRILRTMGGCCVGCQSCQLSTEDDEDFDSDVLLGNYCSLVRPAGVSPLVLGPMTLVTTDPELSLRQQPVMERILSEYRLLCQFYQCSPNVGVVTTIRFALPSLRVAPGFGNVDMLALAELLLRYGNGPLQCIRRLDFARRRLCGAEGLGSHGALTLAKVLQVTEHVKELFLERNKIGSFGASAIFMACATNSSMEKISMRRCRVGERGAIAFATYLVPSKVSALRIADLSSNYIGYRGSIVIEKAVQERERKHLPPLILDLEGNLVFQEIMNSVTHGLGVLLAFAGAGIMSEAVRGSSQRHVWSCGVYSTSLVVLYISSTLFHSFFTMRHTKWVFEVLDKCAIYILIAGSYTPFLQVILAHEPLWSEGLLGFLWLLCVMGVGVEFFFPSWQHKGKFSLAMYLGMGWSALVCLPEVARTAPHEAIDFMALGGVAYTAGVPFFVRNNSTCYLFGCTR